MEQNRVYQALRRAIYAGEIKPGEKLVERKLVERFETSRGPLRESLLRLMGEGLIQREPRRACFVSEISPDDISDMYFMRLAIEPLAARLVASSPSEELLQRLDGLVDAMSSALKSGASVKSAEADFEFHREIVIASESPRLIQAYDMAHVPMLVSKLTERPPVVLRNLHEGILEAIRRGEPQRAELEARKHVEEAFRRNVPFQGRARYSSR